MKTRVTELLGIQYPIIQAAMADVAIPQLVAAVSNAGGLGMLSTALTTEEELRNDIAAVRQLTSKPFGVSLIPFSPGITRLLDVVIEEQVPAVAVAFGSPTEIFARLKGHDLIKFNVCGAPRHAVRAEREGADFIVAEGIEAAGHVSQWGNMVLIPRVVEMVKIPVAASGGYSTGRQLAAALTLGAEGVYMGTRFLLTQESPWPPAVKQRMLEAGAADTIVTTNVDGFPYRLITNRLGERIVKRRMNPLSQAIRAWPLVREMKQTYHASWREMIATARGMRRSFNASAAGMIVAIKMARDALKQGDAEACILPVGQGIEFISDMPTCKEVIERVVREAEEALRGREVPAD